MTTKDPLRDFALGLGNKIVQEASKILEKHQLTETMFTVGVKVRPGFFTIEIACNEFIYVVPEVDFSQKFLYPNWEKEIEEFVTSFGRFMAYDYLKYCDIKVPIIDE